MGTAYAYDFHTAPTGTFMLNVYWARYVKMSTGGATVLMVFHVHVLVVFITKSLLALDKLRLKKEFPSQGYSI